MQQITIELASEQQTSQFAIAMAPLLQAGSSILLNGGVGAGKTHFARQLILTRLALIDAVEDIPSPTFTLVQVYDHADPEIWHTDLYRLSDISEIYELGLDAAFDTAICLVEWPDRLGELAPENALTISLETVDENIRTATLQWTEPQWDSIVKTALQAI